MAYILSYLSDLVKEAQVLPKNSQRTLKPFTQNLRFLIKTKASYT